MTWNHCIFQASHHIVMSKFIHWAVILLNISAYVCTRPMNDLCRSLQRDVYCFICVHSNLVLLYCLTSLFDLLSIICNLSDLGELRYVLSD